MRNVADLQRQAKSWFTPYGTKEEARHVAQVFFPVNRSEIDDGDRWVLRRLVGFYGPRLAAISTARPAMLHRDLGFLCVGHADARGGHRFNHRLARWRAQSVAHYLDAYLIEHARYRRAVVSLGERDASPGGRPERMDLDRRVDVFVSEAAKPPTVDFGEELICLDDRNELGRGFGIRYKGKQSLGTVIRGTVAEFDIVSYHDNRTRTLALAQGSVGSPAIKLGKVPKNRPKPPAPEAGFTRFTLPDCARLADFEGGGRMTQITVHERATVLEFDSPRLAPRPGVKFTVTLEQPIGLELPDFEGGVAGRWWLVD